MSGRGTGNKRWRGRGKAKTQGTSSGKGSSKPNQSKERKSLSDYIYYFGTAKNASDYLVVTQYLINYIQRTYTNGEDIALALEKKQEMDFTALQPSLQASSATDAAVKALEEKQFEILYKAEVNAFVQRKEQYNANKGKAFALLFGQCTKSMQNKLLTRPDYESTIKGNPIALLLTIQEYTISFQENKLGASVVADSIRNLFNMKQKEDESLIDYTRRFKAARDIMHSMIGEELRLPKLAQEDTYWDDNNATIQEECYSRAYNQLLTYTYLDNADKSKYGSLIKDLSDQYSLGNNQYPTSVTEAAQVLGNRKFDQTFYDNKKKKKDGNKQSKQGNEQPSTSTDEQQPLEMTFAQMEGNCYCCGKKGHLSSSCRYKSKPKSEWYINKTKEAKQINLAMAASAEASAAAAASTTGSVVDAGSVAGSVAQESTGATGATPTPSFMFAMLGMPLVPSLVQPAVAPISMKDELLLDSASSVHLFCNKKMVQDVSTTDQALALGTNAGTAVVDQQATLAGYKSKVWFNSESITNVLSLGILCREYPVSFSNEEKAFTITTPNAVHKFVLGDDNLFKLQKQPTHNQGLVLVETVAENSKFYTKRQVERAKLARNLLHAIGCPSINDLKAVVRMNAIKNNPVTLEDINLAEAIFGKDLATLKGKTTRTKPNLAVRDMVDVPKQLYRAQKEVDLCFDTMFINKMPFLASISKRIMYRTATWTPTRQLEDYRRILVALLHFYRSAGFKVKRVYCDREYKPLVDSIKDEYRLEPHYANAQEHVPEAERNIRTIKERFRAAFQRLPYKALPRLLIEALVTECARTLNYFPPKGGCSKFYSPRMIMYKQHLDYKKSCSIPPLSYVQATDESDPTNTPAARTIDGIYLRPTNSERGGHEVMNLATGQPITRSVVKAVPVTPAVIAAVEALAKRDGMKSIKVTTKHGKVLFDSALIAGVDEAPEADEDESDDESYTESESTDDESLEDMDEIDPNELEEEVPIQPDQQPIQQPTDAPMDEQSIDSTPDPEEEAQDEVPLEQQPLNQHQLRRSTRASQPPQRLEPNLKGKSYYQDTEFPSNPKSNTMEYTLEEAFVLATIMDQFNQRMDITKLHHGTQCVTQYSLQKGIKKFGERGRQSALKEMKQLHDRECFQPIHKSDLNSTERKRALESLIFMVEKRDGTIKSRHCANGSTQRAYMAREDVSSPTVSTESTILTAVIEAQEGRDVATCDIPNAFIQTEVEKQDSEGNKTIMKIRGVLVDILCEMDPVYKDYVVMEGNSKVLYVHITKAIYGLLVSAMLFYKKLSADLQGYGFEINPYDPCVANKMVEGKQLTVSWHVDDLKASHMSTKVLDEFLQWIKDTYGAIGEVKTTRGKLHDYLGMKLDYSVPGQVSIDMVDYVEYMVNEFPQQDLQGGKPINSPWNDHLFRVLESSPSLSKEAAEQFHTTTAQGLFLCKRARPDICPAIAYFTTRVRNPNQDDWNKLVRMMKFLKQTSKDRLTLRADGSGSLKWYVDASFAVHPDYRSHTGAVMTMGDGAVASICKKQSMNTRSSTEAELVGADDSMGPILWTKQFLEAQGYPVKENILFQDNKSSILLESNGRKSAGKRSRHLNIRYFFVTDQKAKGNIDIQYCPTDQMKGDYMTKPLHGKKFIQFRQDIMNLPLAAQLMMAGFVL